MDAHSSPSVFIIRLLSLDAVLYAAREILFYWNQLIESRNFVHCEHNSLEQVKYLLKNDGLLILFNPSIPQSPYPDLGTHHAFQYLKRFPCSSLPS